MVIAYILNVSGIRNTNVCVEGIRVNDCQHTWRGKEGAIYAQVSRDIGDQPIPGVQLGIRAPRGLESRCRSREDDI